MLSETPFSCQKKFYAKMCNVTLNFNKHGGITGWLFPFPAISTISTEVVGLYSIINYNPVLYFTCDFIDPNLPTMTGIHFAGEVIKYENDRECLIIKWLMRQEILSITWTDSDVAILWDARYEDEAKETRKVRDHISKHSLHLVI